MARLCIRDLIFDPEIVQIYVSSGIIPDLDVQGMIAPRRHAAVSRYSTVQFHTLLHIARLRQIFERRATVYSHVTSIFALEGG